jgi:hypothetical protein
MNSLIKPYFSDIFREELKGYFGAELELVLCKRNVDGSLIPALAADKVLKEIWRLHPNSKEYFDKEFYWGQIEIKSGPHKDYIILIDDLLQKLEIAHLVANSFGYELHAIEYFKGNISIGTNPLEPRYAEYAIHYPEKVDAMCRVASLHVHRGVASLKQAIDVYNAMVSSLSDIMQNGWIDEKRFNCFDKVIFPGGWFPPEYKSIYSLVEHARSHDFLSGLRGNYSAVRIHEIYGTVEMRAFGAVMRRDELVKRFEFIDNVCSPHMNVD